MSKDTGKEIRRGGELERALAWPPGGRQRR